jgi:hypothetical protein
MFVKLRSDNNGGSADPKDDKTPSLAGPTREIICIHCGGHNEVGVKAMSVFCKHCSRRLVVEDFQIKGFHAARSFDTCGDVIVERRGQLAAFVRAKNLVVRGKVKGDVEARGRVEISRTGELQGNVTAPALVVETGGMIEGEVRIGQPPNRPDLDATDP